jgi:hypothetical protein
MPTESFKILSEYTPRNKVTLDHKQIPQERKTPHQKKHALNQRSCRHRTTEPEDFAPRHRSERTRQSAEKPRESQENSRPKKKKFQEHVSMCWIILELLLVFLFKSGASLHGGHKWSSLSLTAS